MTAGVKVKVHSLKDVQIEGRPLKSIPNRLYLLRKRAATRSQDLIAATAATLAKKTIAWTAAEDISLRAQLNAGVKVKDVKVKGRSRLS